VGTVVIGTRILIGLVFAASALSKLRRRADYHAFVATVRQWTGVRPGGAGLAASLVAAELAVPVLLAVPGTVPVGLVLAALLLAGFAAAMVVVLRRGVPTPCRCFGASVSLVSRRHVVRNFTLLVVAGGGLAGGLSGATSASPAATVVAAGAAVVVAVIVIGLDDIAAVLTAEPAPAHPSRPPRRRPSAVR
jgi:hypothetical protein